MGPTPKRPLATDEFQVPTENGLRLDEQQARIQAGTRAATQASKPVGEHRQGQPIPAREAERSDLRALKDRQLSAQQEDFDLFALVRSQEQAGEVDEHPDQL